MTRSAQPTGAIAYGRARPAGKEPQLEAQRHEVEAWARRTKTTITQWYVDEAGRSRIEERSALMGALCSLAPTSRVLCIARPDVLDEGPWARAVVEHLAVHAGGSVTYATVGAPVDAGAALGPRDLSQVLDTHERMLLRFQVRRATEIKQPRDAIWGRVPWGYRLAADGMRLEPCPAEQAVVDVARHMRLRGLKLRQIAEELTNLGVVGRTGKPLGITRIYELLDEGEGSRLDVLAERAATDPDASPESSVRPTPRPDAPGDPARSARTAPVASGQRRARASRAR
jgi:site-specific DNA recombinase